MQSSTSSVPTIQPLQLRPHQVAHYQRILEILSRFYFFVDGSEMGTGKTYVTAAVAITQKLPVIVVCPVAARQTWLNVFQAHGVTTYNLPETGGVITYDSLRSKKGYQPKHGLLTRDDTGTTPLFYPTTLFVQLVQAGVLVIFDECQKLKNNGNQNAAAKALVRQVYAIGGRSRIAFLSGSALDK
jgi:superfamily II DNA or RNA helicase